MEYTFQENDYKSDQKVLRNLLVFVISKKSSFDVIKSKKSYFFKAEKLLFYYQVFKLFVQSLHIAKSGVVRTLYSFSNTVFP